MVKFPLLRCFYFLRCSRDEEHCSTHKVLHRIRVTKMSGKNSLTSVRPLFSSTTTIVLSTYVLSVVPFFVRTSVALFLYVLMIEPGSSSAYSCEIRSLPRSSNFCLSSSGEASKYFLIFSKILSVYFAAVCCSKLNG